MKVGEKTDKLPKNEEVVLHRQDASGKPIYKITAGRKGYSLYKVLPDGFEYRGTRSAPIFKDNGIEI